MESGMLFKIKLIELRVITNFKAIELAIECLETITSIILTRISPSKAVYRKEDTGYRSLNDF